MNKFLLFCLPAIMSASAFADTAAPTYRMKVETTDGHVTYFRVNDVKEVTFDEFSAPGTGDGETVEVCGIKWAKGNLQYFNRQWRLAPHQWETTVYRDGSNDQTLEPEDDSTEYFGWGAVGQEALDGSWCDVPAVDLSQMYSDWSCTTVTTDYADAVCGDLAMWATSGTFRMPTRDEFETLVSQASQRYGYYKTEDGNKIYGNLFFNPQGEREVEYEESEFSDSDLDSGLFLPMTGQMYRNQVLHAGRSGYYWTSSPSPSSSNGRDASLMEVTADGPSVFFSMRSLGCAVRPVLYEESTSKPYTDMTFEAMHSAETGCDRVRLDLSDDMVEVLYVDDADVYVRKGNYAVLLSATGIENKVEKDYVLMGSVKGDFRIVNGMPAIVGNEDSEESIENLLAFPKSDAVVPVDATPAEIDRREHRCDLVALKGVHLLKSEWGFVKAEKDGAEVVVADGFNLSAIPEECDPASLYDVEGIFASADEMGAMVYPVKPVTIHTDAE